MVMIIVNYNVHHSTELPCVGYPMSDSGTANVQIHGTDCVTTADAYYEKYCDDWLLPILFDVDEKKKNEIYLNSLPGRHPIKHAILPTIKPFNNIKRNKHVQNQRYKK